MNSILCLGTYSGVVQGYEIRYPDEVEIPCFKLIFSVSAHESSICSLHTSGNHLFTGSSNETIRIYDLKQRKERGILTGHNGSVTAITAIVQKNSPHLVLSGSYNGSIILWQGNSKGWDIAWQATIASAPVRSVALHHSRKLGLSTHGLPKSKDLCMWDLESPSPLCKQRFKDEPRDVCWAPQSNTFALLFPLFVTIKHFSTCSSEEEKEVNITLESTHPREYYSAIAFVDSTTLLLASSNHRLWGYKIEDKATMLFSKEPILNQRVKSICPLPSNESELNFATCESEGFLRLWGWKDQSEELELITELDTRARITCMDVGFVSE